MAITCSLFYGRTRSEEIRPRNSGKHTIRLPLLVWRLVNKYENSQAKSQDATFADTSTMEGIIILKENSHESVLFHNPNVLSIHYSAHTRNNKQFMNIY